MDRHTSWVVTWTHTSALSGSVAQTDSETPASYRVQVHDDFPRQRLHLPDQLVRLDSVWRQDEAAQQTHFHDGHPSSVQTQARDQAAGASRRRETGRVH